MCFWSADGSAGAPGSERLYIREPVWNLKNVHRRYQKDWNWKLPRTFYVTSFFIEHSCSDFQKGFCKKKNVNYKQNTITHETVTFSAPFFVVAGPPVMFEKNHLVGDFPNLHPPWIQQVPLIQALEPLEDAVVAEYEDHLTNLMG